MTCNNSKPQYLVYLHTLDNEDIGVADTSARTVKSWPTGSMGCDEECCKVRAHFALHLKQEVRGFWNT
jgi:hypothetical protein